MPPRRKAPSRRASAPASPPPALELPAEATASSPLSPIPSTSSSAIPSSSRNTAARSVPSSTFATFRSELRQELTTLSEKLRQRRAEGAEGLDEETAGQLVDEVLDAVGKPTEGEEAQEYKKTLRRSALERSLEEMLMDVALYPVDASAASKDSYGLLCDILDIVLVCQERDLVDESTPLNCVSNLIELETIVACEYIFTWIESRVERLTKGMQATRGKGPVLLRISNELLRRLPRSKQEHVVFSGRILMFLSSSFPLSEKSGVNLRGNFNVGKVTEFEQTSAVAEEEKMDVDDGKKVSDANAELYSIFWSLQRVFTNPPSLFVPAVASTSTTPAAADAFATLRTALEKTLAVFAAATKKEKELGGAAKDSPASAGKQKAADDEESIEHYFFPKFLTSKNLLELELADPAFRRQILVQMLVLYQFLLSFAPAEHARLKVGTTNQAALLNFVLSSENEKWLRELKRKTLNEMDNMQGGRRFRDSIELILQREQNWISWKLKSCVPFEKAPLAEGQSDIARNKLKALGRKPKGYMHAMGNPNLSRSWQHNTTTLEGFVPSEAAHDDFDKLAREYRMASGQVKQKKAQLKQAEEAKASSKVADLSSQLEQLDIKLSALHWRAIRAARASYLHLFAHIGAGDLEALLGKIEDERRAKEEAEERAARRARGEPEPEPEPEVEEEHEREPEASESVGAEQKVTGVDEKPEGKGVELAEEAMPASAPMAEEDVEAAKAKLVDLPVSSATAEEEEKKPTPAPTTPKRARAEEDVAMADGGREDSPESKRRKLEQTAKEVAELAMGDE